MKVLALVFLALVGASQARVTCINCEEDKQFPSFSIECEICEYMIKIIGELGTDEEPKIEEVVDKVCSKLGSFFEKACDALVRSYLPKLLDALKNGATEQEACSVIRMCSSKKAAVAPVVAKQTKGVECTLCETLVKAAAQYVGQDQSVIEQKLEEFCSHLSILSGPCDDLVKEYIPEIIKYLEEGQTADEVCQKIGLCSSRIAAQKAFMAHLTGQTKGVTCDLCDEVCKWIEDYGANKGIEAIEHYVDGKCDDLPFIGSECKDLVNKWLNKLVPLLQKDLPPQKVCDDVHLC
jgi:hypothetical protein